MARMTQIEFQFIILLINNITFCDSGYKIGRTVCGMIGKYGVTTYFNSMYLWSAELSPTVIR